MDALSSHLDRLHHVLVLNTSRAFKQLQIFGAALALSRHHDLMKSDKDKCKVLP